MYGQPGEFGQIGDWLLVRGRGDTRRGEILSVRATSGGALYTVRWLDTGGTAIVCPGEEAVVVSAAAQDDLDRDALARIDRFRQELTTKQ